MPECYQCTKTEIELASLLNGVNTLLQRSNDLLAQDHPSHSQQGPRCSLCCHENVQHTQEEAFSKLQQLSLYVHKVLCERCTPEETHSRYVDKNESGMKAEKDAIENFLDGEAETISYELCQMERLLGHEQQKSLHRLQLLFNQFIHRQNQRVQRECLELWCLALERRRKGKTECRKGEVQTQEVGTLRSSVVSLTCSVRDEERNEARSIPLESQLYLEKEVEVVPAASCVVSIPRTCAATQTSSSAMVEAPSSREAGTSPIPARSSDVGVQAFDAKNFLPHSKVWCCGPVSSGRRPIETVYGVESGTAPQYSTSSRHARPSDSAKKMNHSPLSYASVASASKATPTRLLHRPLGIRSRASLWQRKKRVSLLAAAVGRLVVQRGAREAARDAMNHLHYFAREIVELYTTKMGCFAEAVDSHLPAMIQRCGGGIGGIGRQDEDRAPAPVLAAASKDEQEKIVDSEGGREGGEQVWRALLWEEHARRLQLILSYHCWCAALNERRLAVLQHRCIPSLVAEKHALSEVCVLWEGYNNEQRFTAQKRQREVTAVATAALSRQCGLLILQRYYQRWNENARTRRVNKQMKSLRRVECAALAEKLRSAVALFGAAMADSRAYYMRSAVRISALENERNTMTEEKKALREKLRGAQREAMKRNVNVMFYRWAWWARQKRSAHDQFRARFSDLLQSLQARFHACCEEKAVMWVTFAARVVRMEREAHQGAMEKLIQTFDMREEEARRAAAELAEKTQCQQVEAQRAVTAAAFVQITEAERNREAAEYRERHTHKLIRILFPRLASHYALALETQFRHLSCVSKIFTEAVRTLPMSKWLSSRSAAQRRSKSAAPPLPSSVASALLRINSPAAASKALCRIVAPLADAYPVEYLAGSPADLLPASLCFRFAAWMEAHAASAAQLSNAKASVWEGAVVEKLMEEKQRQVIARGQQWGPSDWPEKSGELVVSEVGTRPGGGTPSRAEAPPPEPFPIEKMSASAACSQEVHRTALLQLQRACITVVSQRQALVRMVQLRVLEAEQHQRSHIRQEEVGKWQRIILASTLEKERRTQERDAALQLERAVSAKTESVKVAKKWEKQCAELSSRMRKEEAEREQQIGASLSIAKQTHRKVIRRLKQSQALQVEACARAFSDLIFRWSDEAQSRIALLEERKISCLCFSIKEAMRRRAENQWDQEQLIFQCYEERFRMLLALRGSMLRACSEVCPGSAPTTTQEPPAKKAESSRRPSPMGLIEDERALSQKLLEYSESLTNQLELSGARLVGVGQLSTLLSHVGGRAERLLRIVDAFDVQESITHSVGG